MRDRKSMDSHRIDELIDELIGESPETATHVPASIQRAGAAWYKTKKAMDDLAVKMEYLKDQKKEIEKDLISAIEAMQDQRLRVDDVYITLSRRVSPSYGKAFENACALLKSVSERLYEKAVEFSGEVASETKLLLVRKAEASVFDRLKGLVSRIWDWLKQTDRDIARLEKAAYFEVDEMVDGLLEQDGGIREPGKADRQYPEHDALTHHNDPEPADQDEDIPLTDELKAKIIQAAIPLAIKLGTENGKGVAGWVEQDTWGGRVTRGEREAAQAVLKGIEDGDPAVLDDLPRPNAGDKSDIMNELLDDAAWAVDKLELSDEEKTELLDEADEVWDEYIMAYTRVLQDELVRMARAFLKEEE